MRKPGLELYELEDTFEDTFIVIAVFGSKYFDFWLRDGEIKIDSIGGPYEKRDGLEVRRKPVSAGDDTYNEIWKACIERLI